MTTIYDRGRALAIRQLAPLSAGGKGGLLTLQHVTPSAYVPGGVLPAPTITNYDGSGIRTNYSSRDIDGVLVQADDVKLIVSPQLIDGGDMPQPAIDDAIIFDGASYSVVRVSAWNYAGVNCGFVVQGRK